MNRTAIYLSLVVLFSSCITAKISWDRIEKENVRHIGTNGMTVVIGKATYHFNLTVFSKSQSNDYCLLISSISKIDSNCIVLLKLENEEVIKLQADNLHTGIIDWPTFFPIIGLNKPAGVIATKKVDYHTSIYSLTPELLDKIEKTGVLKIRIQYGENYNEKRWANDNLGVFLQQCHKLIESQLQKNPSSLKAIEQNF